MWLERQGLQEVWSLWSLAPSSIADPTLMSTAAPDLPGCHPERRFARLSRTGAEGPLYRRSMLPRPLTRTIQKSVHSATLVAVKKGAAVAVFVLVATCFASAQAQVPNTNGPVATPTSGNTGQAASPPTGIPTFYAHSRQVIVEAEVWNPVDKKNPGDASWIPQGSLDGLPDGGAGLREILKGMPPPARGLTARDLHVFDNGVEQEINYFKEAAFPAFSSASAPWRFVPTAHGIWGTPWGYGGISHGPSAAYLIGYVPSALQTGECHSIRIVAPNHYVQINRNQYCTATNSREGATLLETKLEARMQGFANSTAPGVIKVSARALVFWSSGVLSLARQAGLPGAEAGLPGTDFTYVVEVHDSQAPATVQIATEFALPYPVWKYPCHKNSAVHVLGMVYKTNGHLEGQFGDTFRCDTWTSNPKADPLKKFIVGSYIPSLFDTQLELRPGEYEVRVVVSDGNNFGGVRVPFRVEPLSADELAVSDIVSNSILRDSSWVVRDATSLTPAPIIPAPLVSKNVQFLPVAGAQLGKRSPLSVYFEIYEPLLETQATAVSFRVKVTDLKTSSLVMDTEPMSAADWVVPGNAVIPIGLKLATEKLDAGSYRLEIQASDSAGRQTEWRQTTFVIK